MKLFISVTFNWVLAFLVLIQKDETGELLVNGHIALAFVCLMLFGTGIAQLLDEIIFGPVRADLEYEDDDDEPQHEFNVGNLHPTNKELTRSRDLDALFEKGGPFEHKGSFGSLVHRHDR